MATVLQTGVPISSLAPGANVEVIKTSSTSAINLLIYFIIIFIIVWIILYFVNPSFTQQLNPLTETHNGIPDMTKIFIWSLVLAIIIVAIIYFLRK
jgi:amino acid transporter